jgi:transposase
MIVFPPEVRVWLASGHTDMRKGFATLALLVQEKLKTDPHCGHLFVFRGRRDDLLKVIWHDGQGACLFCNRLERGRFNWPTSRRRSLAISSRASTGAHRSTRGGRWSRDDRAARV